jgi:hypothetical protein
MRPKRLCLSVIVVLIAMLSLASVAAASPTIVNVRVEGATHTIFEAPVVTDGHTVSTAAGGTHVCDGTNGGANPTPGPSATAALDDAAAADAFTWDGTFSTGFDDFFITRIAEDAQTDTQFWGVLLNFQFTPVGGCQQRVHFADQVLFAFDAFNKQHFLRLTGPNVVHAGQPMTVRAVDGQSGQPIPGATVGPIDNTAIATTDASGRAQVTFQNTGLKRLKAERADSIRSNALSVLVQQPSK